ncbi:MAG: hypothetical protein S4CHLAM6_11500 [Chlamydiae bacterium]|nr:hypothetical protein [Chlamydiota bacterium]
MKKVYLFPNLVTAFSLSCGLFIIFRIILFADVVTYKLFEGSVILMLVAGLADVCDGAIARILNAETDFGIQFDSLADSVTFGVAPAVIILRSFHAEPASGLFLLLTASAMIFSICGILRLARYNTKAVVRKKTPKIAKDSRSFTGLPIPAAALAVVSMNLIFISNEFPYLSSISQKTRSIIMICSMVVTGYFMVSRWKFPSLKTFNIRIKSFYLVAVTAAVAVVFLYGIFHLFAFIFFVSFWGYIVTAWVLSCIRAIAGKRSKTLKELDPDDDSDES